MAPETAFIYRRGLTKADICKDTFNLRIRNEIILGDQSQSVEGKEQDEYHVPCLSSLICDLVDLKRLNL